MHMLHNIVICECNIGTSECKSLIKKMRKLPESQFPDSLLATYSAVYAIKNSVSETLICCLSQTHTIYVKLKNK